jgi:hypothetical protein
MTKSFACLVAPLLLAPAIAAAQPVEQNCCGSNNTLAAGARWSGGPFTCESSAAGRACKRSDGRGFSIDAKGGGRVY